LIRLKLGNEKSGIEKVEGEWFGIFLEEWVEGRVLRFGVLI
jgi:hypothetical protein